MSFFEPLPPPRESTGPYGPSWAPPAWDRPSEGVAPAIVPINQLLGRDDRAALVLRNVAVYPNGVVLEIRIFRDPHQPLDHMREHFMMRPDLWPRIGVEFADGRRAGNSPTPFFMAGPDVPRDDEGLPTVPVLVHRGGGGGSTEFNQDYWLYPLPPEGPLKVYATFPAIGLEEATVEIDGSAIRRAAKDAVVLWD